MWLDKKELSDWAYGYCLFKEDKPEIRKFITTSLTAYSYCRDVKDRPEIRKFITESRWAFYYCTYVKDRPEIRKYIKEDECGYYYDPRGKQNMNDIDDVVRSKRNV